MGELKPFLFQTGPSASEGLQQRSRDVEDAVSTDADHAESLLQTVRLQPQTSVQKAPHMILESLETLEAELGAEKLRLPTVSTGSLSPVG